MPSTTQIAPFSRNAKFLKAIFGDDWSRALVAWFPGDPENLNDADWTAHLATSLPNEAQQQDLNTYFCPSLVTGNRRVLGDFVSFHVIVVDDIGTKVALNQAVTVLGPPCYLIETSPKNYQAGWRTEPISDLAWVRGMLRGLRTKLGAGDNLTDPMVWRRLPVGINGKAKYRGLGMESA